jgi:hypothetical protein
MADVIYQRVASFTPVVQPNHRAAICQLHALGYKPFHLAAVFPYKINTIKTIVSRLKPFKPVVLKDIPEAVLLMTGAVKFKKGLLSPYEYNVLLTEGLSAYLEKTGRSEESIARDHFYPSGKFLNRSRFTAEELRAAVLPAASR